jgi:2-iminobutanoate/2-iminopropanoate deaminase
MRILLCLFLLEMVPFAAAGEKKIIRSANPNFSLGVLVDGTLYVAGQTGADPKTGKKPDEFEAELKMCLNNVGSILKQAGMDYDDVVAVQVYLTDMDLFSAMRPTRTTVGVAKLSGGSRVEITVTARK